MYKMDLRYLNGKIYKIVSNVTGDVYYGSTILSLKDRLRKHKTSYKRYLEGKADYYTSFKIIETGDYDIHLVEDYQCLCRSQLEAIEHIYIQGYTCINKNVVGRTHKESCKAYYQRNKDEYKDYYQRNRDKLLERQKQKFDCGCGGRYTRSSKSQHYKSNKHLKYLDRC